MLLSAAESHEVLEQVVFVVAGAATSLSSAAAAPQTLTFQTPRPRAVKIDAPKFDGADGDKLIHCLLAVERRAKAQLIDSNEQMVSYAISNLRGRASEWAFSTLLANECAFDTWDIFRARITAMYQPPNNEVLLQGRFFFLRQGKLSLERYIQEMRSLEDTISRSATLQGSPSLALEIRRETTNRRAVTTLIEVADPLRQERETEHLSRSVPLLLRQTLVGVADY
uniref:Retrotransposon gag domain-containing protein n=1 Tax=Globisporangium ultimum (strain ATCC 200006 / CBS 805.95 / DAOM BR144) TaxID=431595 RepID=K3WQZ9_GLOUD